jgi:hypothetical protein
MVRSLHCYRKEGKKRIKSENNMGNKVERKKVCKGEEEW